MSYPAGLTLYRAATRALSPLAPLALKRRAAKGKEDGERLNERRGRPAQARPEGELIWIHAASVGESLVALSLADALKIARPQASILLTSGTATSAKLVAAQAPDGVTHQFIPADRLKYVRRFLDHWRPDLAVFVESELWPNLIVETARTGAKMALVNARMNAASLKNWARWRRTAAWLLACFDWIGAADARTAEGLSRLSGEEVEMAGNLKLEAAPRGPDPSALAAALAAVAGRPLMLAASTHDGEEALILDAFETARAIHHEALLILAPRHPERGDTLAKMVETRALSCARRSKGEAPDADTAVWLADTLGEMGLWFALKPAAVIAGSFKTGIGGHNPVEATRGGAAVISGPHRDSFSDVYDAYEAQGAVATATDADALAEAVQAVWRGEGPAAAAGEAALAAMSGGAMARTVERLAALLEPDPEPEDDF
jgi:3-deoxy-D-manno-octulosonic-acid transferase